MAVVRHRARVRRSFNLRDASNSVTTTATDARCMALPVGATIAEAKVIGTGGLSVELRNPGTIVSGSVFRVWSESARTIDSNAFLYTAGADPVWNSSNAVWDLTLSSAGGDTTVAVGDRLVHDPDQVTPLTAYKYEDGAGSWASGIVTIPSSGELDFYVEGVVSADLYVYSASGAFDAKYYPDTEVLSPNPWVTPFEFGGKGNDSADDSVALQKVMSYFEKNGRGHLMLPQDSVFKCINVQILSSNITISGGGVLKAFTASTTQSILKIGDGTLGNVENITIDGVEFDGSEGANGQAATNAQAIYMDAARNVTVTNCYIHDTVMDGIYVGVNAVGLADPCEDIFITNNKIDTCHRNCISIVAGDHVVVSGNRCLNFGTLGIDVEPNENQVSSCKRITVANNYVRPAATSIFGQGNDRSHAISVKNAVATHEDDYSDVVISGNTVEGIDDGGTIYPSQGIGVQDYYSVTIIGNTVTNCRRGLYLGVDDTVSLATGASTITATGNSIRDNEEWGAWLGARVNFTGNTVEKNGGGIQIYQAFCVVSGNTVRANGQGTPSEANSRGIHVFNQAGGANAGSIISHNLVFDDQAVPTQTYGIYLANDAHYCVVIGNLYWGNITADYNNDGGTPVELGHNLVGP